MKTKDKEDCQQITLQESAIAKFGMEIQLQHAVEELTELSLEVQRSLRQAREGNGLVASLELVSEFCDVHNGLKTIKLFLLDHHDEITLERVQKIKNLKFAKIIKETNIWQNGINDELCAVNRENN